MCMKGSSVLSLHLSTIPFIGEKTFQSKGYTMKLLFNPLVGNTVLIIGDSSLRNLVLDGCDIACVPGALSEDLIYIINPLPVANYTTFILLIGGNSL